MSSINSVDDATTEDSPVTSALPVRGSLIGRSTFEEVHATRLLRVRVVSLAIFFLFCVTSL